MALLKAWTAGTLPKKFQHWLERNEGDYGKGDQAIWGSTIAAWYGNSKIDNDERSEFGGIVLGTFTKYCQTRSKLGAKVSGRTTPSTRFYARLLSLEQQPERTPSPFKPAVTRKRQGHRPVRELLHEQVKLIKAGTHIEQLMLDMPGNMGRIPWLALLQATLTALEVSDKGVEELGGVAEALGDRVHGALCTTFRAWDDLDVDKVPLDNPRTKRLAPLYVSIRKTLASRSQPSISPQLDNARLNKVGEGKGISHHALVWILRILSGENEPAKRQYADIDKIGEFDISAMRKLHAINKKAVEVALGYKSAYETSESLRNLDRARAATTTHEPFVQVWQDLKVLKNATDLASVRSMKDLEGMRDGYAKSEEGRKVFRYTQPGLSSSRKRSPTPGPST